MYQKVQSQSDFRVFKKTWERICEKQKWLNDPYAPDGVRYILSIPFSSKFSLWKRNRIIGTIEFLPYSPSNPYSSVEGPDRYPYSSLPIIREQQDRVWEIDKLCLTEDYQRKGFFEKFFYVFEDHINTYQPKFYIALMEKKFYRMMRMLFGLAIEKRKEFKGPTNSLVAVIFDVEQLMQDVEKVNRLKKLMKKN